MTTATATLPATEHAADCECADCLDALFGHPLSCECAICERAALEEDEVEQRAAHAATLARRMTLRRASFARHQVVRRAMRLARFLASAPAQVLAWTMAARFETAEQEAQWREWEAALDWARGWRALLESTRPRAAA